MLFPFLGRAWGKAREEDLAYGVQREGEGKRNLRRETPLFFILYCYMELPTLLPRQTHRHKHRHSDALRETKKRVKLRTPKGSSLLPASVS